MLHRYMWVDLLFGALLTAAYPLVLGLVALNAAVQVRSRPAGGRARRGFDALITASAAVVAVCWGVLLDALATGLPIDGGGSPVPPTAFLTPVPLLSGLAMLTLTALHGATFLAWRAFRRRPLPRYW
jgi:cytochrome d ubiquinol oxidase subunit II